MTTECRLVYGYLYAGSEAPDQVPVRWNAIATTATKLELLLGTVFVDYRIKPLAMDRVALRALFDVVVAYHPYGVLIPSMRHLSRWLRDRCLVLSGFDRSDHSAPQILLRHRGKPSRLDHLHPHRVDNGHAIFELGINNRRRVFNRLPVPSVTPTIPLRCSRGRRIAATQRCCLSCAQLALQRRLGAARVPV